MCAPDDQGYFEEVPLEEGCCGVVHNGLAVDDRMESIERVIAVMLSVSGGKRRNVVWSERTSVYFRHARDQVLSPGEDTT